jgi:hypothetical protein
MAAIDALGSVNGDPIVCAAPRSFPQSFPFHAGRSTGFHNRKSITRRTRPDSRLRVAAHDASLI